VLDDYWDFKCFLRRWNLGSGGEGYSAKRRVWDASPVVQTPNALGAELEV
jgi:hypothetical protein